MERAYVCSSLSRVELFATPWTIAHQPRLSIELYRQEYWSGLLCPSPDGKTGSHQKLEEHPSVKHIDVSLGPYGIMILVSFEI